MRKVITILMTIMILAAVLPTRTEAAVTAPADVKAKAAAVMQETGKAQAFIVKTDQTGRGTAYMMRKTSRGKVVCDRSGSVILGKNEVVLKSYAYAFDRCRDTEKTVMNWTQNGVKHRQRYTSFVECTNAPAFTIMIHSYAEYKQGGAWKTCKGLSKNKNGLAMCKEFAHYLWSCADPGCPVAFM
jgi:hypothetical protein